MVSWRQASAVVMDLYQDAVAKVVGSKWRQTKKLMGYSRGSLLQSLALAPREEVTIEISSWERRTRTLEQSTEAETEQSFESAQKSLLDREALFLVCVICGTFLAPRLSTDLIFSNSKTPVAIWFDPDDVSRCQRFECGKNIVTDH